jgi:hypothetical protein
MDETVCSLKSWIPDMENMTVDEFVKTRIMPEFYPVVAMLRGLIREMASGTREEIYYRLCRNPRNGKK